MQTDRQSVSSEKGDRPDRSSFYVFSKITVNLVLILLGAALMLIALGNMQTRISMEKQKENNELALSEVATILEKNVDNAEILTDIYHKGNWKTLDDITELFDKGLFDQMMMNEGSVRSEIFSEISTQAGIPYLYLLSMDGRIVMSLDDSLTGRNPASTAHMTQENLNRILNFCVDDEGGMDPVTVRNMYGTFYFYSKPFEHEGTQYALTAGVSSWALDVRIESLRDVSAVLSRMGVINDGFLFAVSRADGLFLYYNNDEHMLTGQNAFTCGLTGDITADGYSGDQTILGEKYYCTSKVLSRDVAIVAAAKDSDITSKNKFVQLWTVIGFSLIMFLCLTYCIIVHNDFIRHDAETVRFKLFDNGSNPIYFNKTVFDKVLPLLLIGVLAVFGVSFYTQTLLEISVGVDRSNVILQEVIGRYEESLESREIVEDYYNSRFLSIARIITFLVEESPEILNEPSDYYHSYYDESGNRVFIQDDEGNQLRSVANSAALQKLCNENSIKSIYIFDEDGRTIATNTKNWFFSISTNEEDQSYPFRQVLDGRTDSYLQTAMVNDLGEETQYFGVTFNYYTAKDHAGNTVYVSRYDYEEACAAENVSGAKTAGGITKHSSLLQIEMDPALTGSIMAATTEEYVLSTKMLAGGAVYLFDNSRDHICLYSPNSVNIGRTAEELGVSANAFSGNPYYGFSNINGEQFFQYFRYLDEVFIATAIPKSIMFTRRTRIAVITAAVCLFLNMVLLTIITITSKAEEDTYDELRRGRTDDNLNSPVFSIRLPSGIFAGTSRAQQRWDYNRVPWNEMTPEMKLATIVGMVAAIPVLFFVLSAIGISKGNEDGSVVRYMMSGGWDKGPNVFALSASIMVLAMTAIVFQLARIPGRLCTALLGTRGETIGHLMLSIVKYGGTIGALFYCLYLFGIDSASLLASAGILSLVVGLGAQSLITDIIAGIFMVFEGEFRVGDIVTIGGFRGTVTDIGLRTTKISGGGNVKIFNNRDISGVLNMTKETSLASATAGIDYSQDVDKVEEILKRELPALKEDNPRILEGPFYSGITELGYYRYSVSIYARCSEANVRSVNVYLNRELLRILYRNGIITASEEMPDYARMEAEEEWDKGEDK